MLATIGSGDDDGEWLSGPSLFDCEDEQQRREQLHSLAQLEEKVSWMHGYGLRCERDLEFGMFFVAWLGTMAGFAWLGYEGDTILLQDGGPGPSLPTLLEPSSDPPKHT